MTPNNAHQIMFRLRKRLNGAIQAYLLWNEGRRARDLTRHPRRAGVERARCRCPGGDQPPCRWVRAVRRTQSDRGDASRAVLGAADRGGPAGLKMKIVSALVDANVPMRIGGLRCPGGGRSRPEPVGSGRRLRRPRRSADQRGGDRRGGRAGVVVQRVHDAAEPDGQQRIGGAGQVDSSGRDVGPGRGSRRSSSPGHGWRSATCWGPCPTAPARLAASSRRAPGARATVAASSCWVRRRVGGPGRGRPSRTHGPGDARAGLVARDPRDHDDNHHHDHHVADVDDHDDPADDNYHHPADFDHDDDPADHHHDDPADHDHHEHDPVVHDGAGDRTRLIGDRPWLA